MDQHPSSPTFKRDRRDAVRPILQGEALLKIIHGACAKGCGVQITGGMGERQYGGGRSGGASLEAAEVRAAAALRPDYALIGLDIKNALAKWDGMTRLRRLPPMPRSSPSFWP